MPLPSELAKFLNAALPSAAFAYGPLAMELPPIDVPIGARSTLSHHYGLLGGDCMDVYSCTSRGDILSDPASSSNSSPRLPNEVGKFKFGDKDLSSVAISISPVTVCVNAPCERFRSSLSTVAARARVVGALWRLATRGGRRLGTQHALIRLCLKCPQKNPNVSQGGSNIVRTCGFSKTN
jgi:hypothetical protein